MYKHKMISLMSLIALLTGGLVLVQYAQVSATPAPLVLGELPYQKLLSQSLTDRAALLINVANGNLILKTQDLTIGSAGPGLSVTRYLNNLATGSGQIGSHDTLSVGPDINITANANGSATYQGPSGFRVTFPANGSGGYSVPVEFTAASLAHITGGWTLTYHASGEVYTFDGSGKLIKDANNAGLTITYSYNANGTLASATDTQGKTTTFTNYSGINVGKITDPSGRTVQYSYTAGQLTSLIDTTGKTWLFQYYDTRGNLNQITDPRGYTTSLSYDSNNRISTVTYNDFTTAKTIWTYTYNSGNTVIKDPLGHLTTYTYDASGRVTDTLNAIGDHYGASWDANNNQSAVKDPSSQVTTLTHDSLSNLTGRQNPALPGGGAGAKATNDYSDPLQPYHPSKSTDAAGNTIAYSYNTNGNVASANSSAAGGTGMGTVTYKYQGDPDGTGGTIACNTKAGQLCLSIDARGNTTNYGYDTFGNVISVKAPGPVGIRTLTYDNLSRIKTSTDGNGSKVTITYDNADRPTLLSYAPGGSTVAYKYDEDGNLIQRDDGAGQTLWTYDGYNRITKLRQSGKPDLNYTYDTVGNLRTEQGPAGTITYSYDNANQIAGVNQSITGANETFVFTAGRPTTVYIPGNITQTIGYDNAGRQTSIKAVRNGATLTNYTATYTNAVGKDTELMQTETNNLTGMVNSYTYDGLNRLAAVNSSGAGANSFTYSYDNNGNRTQYSKNGAYSAIFSFNAANQLTTAGGAPDGTYDQAGNQTSTGTGLAMGYNPKNQATSFTPPSSSPITVTYSDAGQTDRTQFGTTTQQNGNLGLYSDSTGGVTFYYTHLSTGTGQVLGETISNSTYYYLTDVRGSVVKVVDGIGDTKNTYSYDPYGTLLASSGTVNNPWRYAGGYYDNATGLYKFGARYYNASDARWTQLDPSGQSAGYVYAGDDPINQVDLSGMLTNTISFGFALLGIGYSVGIIGDGNTIESVVGVGPSTPGLSFSDTIAPGGIPDTNTCLSGFYGFGGSFCSDGGIGFGVGTPGISLQVQHPIGE